MVIVLTAVLFDANLIFGSFVICSRLFLAVGHMAEESAAALSALSAEDKVRAPSCLALLDLAVRGGPPL